MRSSDTGLYDLIRGLSTSEKRHFKIFSQLFLKDQQSSLLVLFDLIDQHKNHNQQQFKNLFEGKIGHTNFSQVKADLMKLILKSLRIFHSRHFDKFSLRNRQSDFDILLYKGLDKPASQILQFMQNHPVAISSAMDDIDKNRLSFRLAIKGNIYEEINHLNIHYIENQMIEVKRLTREIQSEHFFIQAYCLFRNYNGFHSPEIESDHKKLLKLIKRFNPTKDKSHVVNINCWKALFFLYFSIFDFKNSKIQAQHIVRTLLSLNVSDYAVWDEISTYLINLFYIEVTQKNIKEASSIYAQLNEIWSNYPLLQNYAKVYRIQSGLIQLYTDLGELNKAKSFAKKVEHMLDETHSDVLAYSALIMNLVWLHLFLYQYDKAWILFQKIPSDLKKHAATDFLVSSRLTALILQLELKNYSLLSSKARSTERLFTGKKLMNESLIIFLRFLKSYSLRLKSKSKQQLFQSLLEQIALLSPSSNNLFSHFPEIAIWVKANATLTEYVLLIRKNN